MQLRLESALKKDIPRMWVDHVPQPGAGQIACVVHLVVGVGSSGEGDRYKTNGRVQRSRITRFQFSH